MCRSRCISTTLIILQGTKFLSKYTIHLYFVINLNISVLFCCNRRYGQRNGSLFADFQELQRIWTHPYVLRLNAEKVEKANEKKRLEASDSEGSLKDFIDDASDTEASSISLASSESNSDIECLDSDKEKPAVVKATRSTRLNPKGTSCIKMYIVQCIRKKNLKH